MKTLGLALFGLALMGLVVLGGPPRAAGAGQEADASLDQLLKDFGRPVSASGVSFLIVHLNDRTTDALFEAPLKFSLRAQARTATMFYVQGAADAAGELNTDFRIQQGAEHYQARTVNISRFTPGTRLSADDEFRGIIVIDKLFDVRMPIDIYYGGLRVTFEFPPSVLAQMSGNQ